MRPLKEIERLFVKLSKCPDCGELHRPTEPPTADEVMKRGGELARVMELYLGDRC